MTPAVVRSHERHFFSSMPTRLIESTSTGLRGYVAGRVIRMDISWSSRGKDAVISFAYDTLTSSGWSAGS
jgi:hypothetical protein